MLYNGRIGSIQKIIFLSLLIVILIALSACSVPKGSIIILENPNGTGFTMDFKEWSSKDKCEISLNEGDVLQIEVFREGGKIALTVSGKNGSEPYTGNDLQSRKFTVTVHETDRYEIQITGKGATGKVIVKKVAADTGA
ncbi:MAG TPA: hypothetical protein P5161_01350 [Eubacteriales bacterium]|jgi:uncharacterized protein|nr:hypothetical protein [Eubacteriales bacterium]HRU84834.1 hypothetical protein [Eubacteriales bacterium]